MAHRDLTAQANRLYNFILPRSFFFFARMSCSEQGTFHGQAFDRVWSFPNCSFKASRRKKKKKPFLPAHNLIRPQPRSSLPYRRRIYNLVVHQRRSLLPCRRSILLRRSASLHRSRTAAPGRARGLALLRNLQGCQRGLSFIFFFLSGFSFRPCFSSFSSRHLVFVQQKNIFDKN